MDSREWGAPGADRVVSFESEELILVNERDEELGHLDKGACHDGEGVLHRAFSVFVFNDAGELLLQQRARGKRLWPGFWSNSCCSHPRRGETMSIATERRLEQELGIRADLRFLFKFQYAASFGEAGSERELCWVYAGRSSQTPRVNPTEIEACRYVAPADLDAEVATQPERFTPWFRLEWQRIRERHMDEIAAL